MLAVRIQLRTVIVVTTLATVAGCGQSKKVLPETSPAPPAGGNSVREAGKPVQSANRIDPAAARLIVEGDRPTFIFPAVQDWTLQETAADSLARIGEPAVPALIVSLSAEDKTVRLNAARALARIGPAAKLAVPGLAKALNDPDPPVRMAAARALGQIGAQASPAIPDLIKALEREPARP
jgi:hypothetical protein